VGASEHNLMGGVVVPVGVDHQITYKFTDLFKFQLLAELPLNSASFSLVVNGVGPWQATLNVEDTQVRKSNWINATAPWLAALWVDIDGQLIYGGPVIGRKYDEASGKATLSGSDFCGYLSQRLQARDYKEYTDPEGHTWSALPGAPAPRIAYYLLAQAMEKQYSLPIDIAYDETEVDGEFWITFSSPITQQQTLMAMMTQLQQLGYLVGVDYAADVQYVAGVPSVSITLSYPRRGATNISTVIEVSAPPGGMEYNEDGSQAGNRVVEQTGAISATATAAEWGPAMTEDGYPLLEKVVSHASLSPTAASAQVLQAYASGDLAVYAYPLLAPSIPLPMFGSPSIFDFLPIGNDVMLKVPTGAGALPSNNPRFPNGLDYRFRAVRLDCTIPDAGLPTMKPTLNIPPGTVPPVPPA
jgi:hypothetical protein